MEERAFYAQLAEILDADVAAVRPEVDLESLGWSSLAVVSFIAFADESFDIILGPRKLAACKTVNDLIQLLDDKVLLQAS
jgi:acyl carrier protein